MSNFINKGLMMPGQYVYAEADNFVYPLDKVLIKIIITIFKENLTRKNGQDNALSSAIEEIGEIKLKDLTLNDILVALDSLDKCFPEENNEFAIKCYDKIVKSDDPKYIFNALYVFFDCKLHKLFESHALSKENFINIIFQHEFPKKLVNIIYVLDKYKLFCESILEKILSLSPQDLNYFEVSLLKTDNEISKKKIRILFLIV